MPSTTLRRRWFRFKLSTVLILTAIAAWAMSCRPFFAIALVAWVSIPADVEIVEGDTYRFFGEYPSVAAERWIDDCKRKAGADAAYLIIEPETRFSMNPRLRWAAIALFAFLTWKAGWAIAAQRRRRREETRTH
jgi:hypothetical protein